MRNVLKNGGKIILSSDSIELGKGDAIFVLDGQGLNLSDAEELIGQETSLMLTPLSIRESDPLELSVTNIFSNKKRTSTRTVVDRLAVTDPPERAEVPFAVKPREERTIPQDFSEYEDENFVSFISDVETLMNEVKKAKNKVSDIQPETMSDKRQYGLALERKELEESIGIDAYVVNDSCASLTINDIGLDLPLNMPRNLGNISAKKLSSSRELWALFRQNFIKIITPKAAEQYIKKAGSMLEQFVPGLEVYDSSYEAEAAMVVNGGAKEAPVLDLSGKLDGDTEEMSNLRMAGASNGISSNSSRSLSGSGNIRRTFHNHNEPVEESLDMFSDMELKERKVPVQAKRNPQGIKTISRAR